MKFSKIITILLAENSVAQHGEFIEASSKQAEVSKHDSGLITIAAQPNRLRRQFTIASSLKAEPLTDDDKSSWPDVCHSIRGDMLIKSSRDSQYNQSGDIVIVAEPAGRSMNFRPEYGCSIKVRKLTEIRRIGEELVLAKPVDISSQAPPYERVPSELKEILKRDITTSQLKKIKFDSEPKGSQWETYQNKDYMTIPINQELGNKTIKMKVYNIYNVRPVNDSPPFYLLVGRPESDGFKTRPIFLRRTINRKSFTWEVISEEGAQQQQGDDQVTDSKERNLDEGASSSLYPAPRGGPSPTPAAPGPPTKRTKVEGSTPEKSIEQDAVAGQEPQGNIKTSHTDLYPVPESLPEAFMEGKGNLDRDNLIKQEDAVAGQGLQGNIETSHTVLGPVPESIPEAWMDLSPEQE